jgi:hypothetical protein
VHVFALIDLLGLSVVVLLLFRVLERMPAYSASGRELRWFGASVFIIATQYYLAWLTWYQRPETLLTAADVAVTFFLLGVRRPRRALSSAAVALAIVALAALQGFIRADVAFTLHLGVLAVCVTRAGSGFSLPRHFVACASAASVLISGGSQWYLMHVMFPNAAYGSTPVFQLRLNVTDHLRVVPFLLFVAPAAWTLAMVARRRTEAGAPNLALAAGSAIFLVLWVLVGHIDEVRIFLPFAFALAPLSCVAAMNMASARTDTP